LGRGWGLGLRDLCASLVCVVCRIVFFPLCGWLCVVRVLSGVGRGRENEERERGREKDGWRGGVDAQRLGQKDGGQKNEKTRVRRSWGFGYFSALHFSAKSSSRPRLWARAP